jgi:hypothetical protein
MPPAGAQRQEERLRDGSVSPEVFDHLVDHLRDVVVPSQRALETEAGPRHVPLDLQGLRSPWPGKNAEDIATVVDVERRVRQEVRGTAPWDHRLLIAVLGAQVGERWGEPEGLLPCDPRSFPTRGPHAVGVQRPWGGPRGKVDTCQVGGSMGDVSRHNHALLDFRLALPQEWTRDAPRRRACQVPVEVQDHTRPEQGLAMRALWGQQVPHGWVPGDDALGRHPWLRQQRRERGERSGLGGPCTTPLRDLEAPLPASAGRGRRPQAPWHSVTAGRQALTPEVWTRLTGRDGETGPVASELGKRRVQTRLERTRTGPPAGRGSTRRALADEGTVEAQASQEATDHDPGSRSHYSLTPPQAPEAELAESSGVELARVIKAGAGSDASGKRGKSEAGRDAYQVRPWEGWHHHLALALLAGWFLIGETPRGQQGTPALTLPPVGSGLSVLLREAVCTFSIASLCRQVQRQ